MLLSLTTRPGVSPACTWIWLLTSAALVGSTLHAAAAQREPLRTRVQAPERVVCGVTGCLQVPPGCRGEVRRSGHGVVAVVSCPR